MTEVVQPRDGSSSAKPPRNPRPSIIFGIVVLVVTFAGLGTWGAVAPIASAVIAPGVVTVDSNRKKVQHLEGGIVKELRVRDGDKVEAGQVLIRLDDTRPRASFTILRGRLDTARAVEKRLFAERDSLPQVSYPETLVARSLTEPRLSEILSGQQSFFEARRTSQIGEISILENRIVQLKDDITGISAQQKAKERQTSLIEEEIQSLEGLLEKGFVERPRLLALQREAARLEGERGEHISEIARAKTRIGETKLQIVQRRRDLREKVVDELRSVQAEISDLEERLGAAKDVLAHIAISAPESGTVVGVATHTVGGVIRPGESILEIVPANDKLIVEARIQPSDIDNIAVGQDVNVRFTSFKQRTTPTASGRVIYVSADRIIDDRSGEPHYISRILLSEADLSRLGDRQLQPGMPAEVMIKTGERTALQYFAQPFLDSMNSAWREE